MDILQRPSALHELILVDVRDCSYVGAVHCNEWIGFCHGRYARFSRHNYTALTEATTEIRSTLARHA
ncbi:hypothetical protein GOP47_0020012 [Adiantum capillus-veneris]|uniref:Uncharacterized protein n=1 Tax=Adiantum capillus-veneris TaxID=13818 RepID=A0A9D4Z953_ADICA|nr:hypothetical protein GOP47_0020012 [Adiantum capillus-veneris]